MPSGVELIVAERERQITAEGWTPEHDDTHHRGELAAAAVAYANPHTEFVNPPGTPIHWSGPRIPRGWPWHYSDYKPGNQITSLVKAGALIAAEIDRLQRALPSPSSNVTKEATDG